MENIDTDEIINNIEAQGIKVVSVGYANFKSIELRGSLEDFIATAKAFNENVIFLQSFSFGEDDFLCEFEKPILGEYDEPPSEDGINLAQFLPELKEYENHIGKTNLLIFRVFYKNQVCAYWHKADWFEAFTDLFDKAQDIFEVKEEAAKDHQAQQQNAAVEEAAERESYLSNLLKEFITDDRFESLKTQKAQQEYILLCCPELNELPQHILKDEISNLNARIQAKKMLQQ